MLETSQSSIKEQTYAACKIASNSESREKLKTLIKKLDSDQYGYIARHEGTQFLSYLMVNQNRAKLQNGPMPIPIMSLEQDEQTILSGAHDQLAQLNERCLISLVQQSPQLLKIVDPYQRYNYQKPEGFPLVSFLDKEIIGSLAELFTNHPAVKILLAFHDKFNNIPPDQLTKTLATYEYAIYKDSVNHKDDELFKLIVTEKPDSARRMMGRYISALMCLKASLSTLDQMIFQSIIRDKQPFFSEENVITANKVSSSVICTLMSLEFQPDANTGMISNWDIVLVKLKWLNEKYSELWRVEEVQHDSSHEFGYSVTLKLQNVNDDLNPFDILKFI